VVKIASPATAAGDCRVHCTKSVASKQPGLTSRSTILSGVTCRNEFTRLQCVTQLTSSSTLLRFGRAFHRLSVTKPLTSGGYNYEPASKQRDVTVSTRSNQPTLFRATQILPKQITMPSYA